MNRSVLRVVLEGLKGGVLEKLEIEEVSYRVVVEMKNAELPMLRHLGVHNLTMDEEIGQDFLNLNQEDPIVYANGTRVTREKDFVHLAIAALFQSNMSRTLEVLRVSGNTILAYKPWRGTVPGETYQNILDGNDWQMPRLQIFIMERFNLGKRAMFRIGRCLARSPRLLHVCFDVEMPKNGLSVFVASLPQSIETPAWPLLEKLDFPMGEPYRYKFSSYEVDVGHRPNLSLFLKAAGHFPALKRLVIQSAGLLEESDGKALAQAAAAGFLPKLKYLSISGGASASHALLEIPTWPLEVLGIVDPKHGITGDFISEQLAQQLQHAFPEASVTYGLPDDPLEFGIPRTNPGTTAVEYEEINLRRHARQRHLFPQEYAFVPSNDEVYVDRCI